MKFEVFILSIDRIEMKENIFRQYDIRGKVGSELNLDSVYDLGLAIAFYFKRNKPGIKVVAIGMDGRSHSQNIKEDLSRAMLDSGLDVVFVGLCPTPVLYFAMFNQICGNRPEAGLMVTASHNPKEYNGIKICLDKKSVWGSEIQIIKNIYLDGKKALAGQSESEKQSKCSCCCEQKDYLKPGKYCEIEAIPVYLDWLKEHFKHLVGINISAVLDSGNGVGGALVPRLIEKFEWKNVKSIFDEVDGDYPNHEADPIVEENMRFVKEILQTTEVQVGVGFDGDCDRMAPMTKDGQLVTGDKMLAIFAEPILKEKEYAGSAIVCDIKASSGLEEIVQQIGGHVILVPSGVSNIKKHMVENNSPLGGELSCHFFFADKYFGYDDGFYAMLRLFEILESSGNSLGELVAKFPKKICTPEIRMDCPDDKKKEIVKQANSFFSKMPDAKIITTDGVKVVKSYGWGILRASNTQPILSLRFESGTQEGLDRIRQDFTQALKGYFDEKFLMEQIFI